MLKKVNARVILLVSVTLFFITACQEPNELGLSSLDKQTNGSFFNDTTTVLAYSEMESAVQSDESTYNLVGSYKDPYFGSTQAGFAFQVMPDTSIQFSPSNIIDSAVLRLQYHSSMGNTNVPITLEVYELSVILNRSLVYYANHALSYKPTPLATFTFTPKAFEGILSSQNYIQIPLPKSFAERFSSISSDYTRFMNGFCGYYIKASSAVDGSILSFNLAGSNTAMILSYDQTETQRFSVSSLCATLNLFDHNGYTDANALLKQQIIDKKYSAGDSLVFLQTMSGVKSKIYFPFIKKWADQHIAVSQAELVIPVANTDLDTYPAPSSLILTKLSGTTLVSAIDLNSSGGAFDAAKKEYRFVISNYIQDLLLGLETDNGLSLVISNYGVSANRVVLKGHKQNGGIRLELKYTKN